MGTALGSGAIVLLIGVLAAATETTMLAPPLGVSAFTCFRRPGTPEARPRSIICGHLLGILAGLAAFELCGATPVTDALGPSVTLQHACAAGLAIATTVALTEGLRCPHPPAAATTLVVALGLLTERGDLLALEVGAVGVALAVHLLRRLRGLVPLAPSLRSEQHGRP